MKWVYGGWLVLFLAVRLAAQPNVPVKLALITESAAAQPAADLLTASFSTNAQIQLLERDQIEKVYHEQALAAGNTDYLKLGRLLGADGLLLLEVVATPQATNLNTRLIAVKPGVILNSGRYGWPLPEITQWADLVAQRVDGFLPKLTVLPKEAIPLSVVNLRSAISSAAGAETEKELKLLTIQRLSAERQLFVTEREKLQAAAEEKGLAGDDTACWNGSYRLEGVIDQNGYSAETLTINAQLTPPKGGVPVALAVSGSRTNLAAVVNALALKVVAALSVQPTATVWSPADEAAQYFAEAQWALKWGAYAEAQAAADSAWALGKRDLDSALVRVGAYVSDLYARVGTYTDTMSTYSPGYDPQTHLPGLMPSDEVIQDEIRQKTEDHPAGLIYRIERIDAIKNVHFTMADALPDERNIDRARHALELYYSYSRQTALADLKIPPVAGSWKWSPWYNLGVADLNAASQVLLNFHFAPASQPPLAEKLAELRDLARTVARWMDQLPAVHGGYYVGDRLLTHDDFSHMLQDNPSIFRCEVTWGYLWQEKPEEAVAMYRELMSSPLFCHFHEFFWLRPQQSPRLAGWNDGDRRRIPQVWSHFADELAASTNVLLQLEARALALAEVHDDSQLAQSFTNLFEAMLTNRETLVANGVDILSGNWGVQALVSAKTGTVVTTPLRDSLLHLYISRYQPELSRMEQEYRDKTVLARKTQSGFARQIQYLEQNESFDFMQYMEIFKSRNYSASQARELQPLVAAYRSNLVAQIATATSQTRSQLKNALYWVDRLQNDINNIAAPPAPQVVAAAAAAPPAPAPPVPSAAPAATVSAPVTTVETATKVLLADTFLELPLSALPGEQISDIGFTAHHWFDGKLLLDFKYHAVISQTDENGNLIGGEFATYPAIALLDPATRHWQIVVCPALDVTRQSYFYDRSVLWREELFNSENRQIRKYDYSSRTWRVLPVSDGANYELFAVNDHLYAANRDLVFEILDGGKSSRILASARRQPARSVLDGQDLGSPTLVPGTNQSLRICTRGNVYVWSGDDWRVEFPAPKASLLPRVFEGGVLFRDTAANFPQPLSYSRLAAGAAAPETLLWQATESPNRFDSRRIDPASRPAEIRWNMPAEWNLARLPATLWRDGMYLLADHSEMKDEMNGEYELVRRKIIPKDGYHSRLLCFSAGYAEPQTVFLKFADGMGCPPVTGGDQVAHQWTPGEPSVWMSGNADNLFLGRENPPDAHGMNAQKVDFSYRPGIWLIPAREIDTRVEAQIKPLQEQQARLDDQKKAVLAKYSHSGSNALTPDEKETALANPAVIAAELDTIDANHNGRLDAAELSFFDANQNQVLETNELAGIKIAQELFAKKVMQKYDRNNDGFLDPMEFDALLQDGVWKSDVSATGMMGNPGFTFFDKNHDGHIDVSELLIILNHSLRSDLRVPGIDNPLVSQFFESAGPEGGRRVNDARFFKSQVEFYWQHHHE